MKGRNNNGHITSRNRGGGHKQMYRLVDFYRKKMTCQALLKELNMIQIDLATLC